MPAHSWDSYKEKLASNYWNREKPSWVHDIPSMTQPEEKAMLYLLTRDYPSDINRIVDAGCFAGASTLAFCRALESRSRKSNMIVSYDLFETNQHSKQVFSRIGKHLDNPSFLGAFLDTISGYSDLVSVVKGDITDFGWTGGVIDILFLDVLKMAHINSHCVREFFPALRCDSLVFQQDFYHDTLPWIPLTMEVFADHFETLAHCRTTLAFRCVKEITEEQAIQGAKRIEEMPLEEQLQLFDQIIERAPSRAARANMILSRLWARHYAGEPVDDAISEIPSEYADLEWVQQKLRTLKATDS